MGWHLTGQCFENGTFSQCPYSTIWEAFKDHAYSASYLYGGWNLNFPDGSQGTLSIYSDDETAPKAVNDTGREMATGFGIQRPAGLALFKAIYAVISQAPMIVIWDDGRCFVADPVVISGVPDWLLKALPPPAVVHSGDDIDAFLERTAKDQLRARGFVNDNPSRTA
jgi:hypothetical protein